MSATSMVPSKKGASFVLARILGEGGNVGVLVDQKFPKGVRTTFFGRRCGTNPLVPKLARHFGCDIYPCRCVRRPGNRFEIEFMDRIVPPTGPDGMIDVAATAQMLNDIVEGWVREAPGQWTWFHRRWEM
jgi:KDO2-lipid IV(A) lauroyltransferase